MSLIAFLGALETGFLYSLVGLGVYLSFRILDFPDLTVDGSFPLGGATAATLIVQGVDPFVATGAAICIGAIAGLITAWLNVKLKILHLLASILTMIALYSVNLRIMGKPNIGLLGQNTIATPLETAVIVPLKNAFPDNSRWVGGAAIALSIALLALLVKFAVDFFLASQIGLAMRATGANPVMAKAQGISTATAVLLGMAMSNALVAFAGALFAQLNGFADVTMGVGTIVFGLAAVIIGETFVPALSVRWATFGVIIGSVVYRFAVAIALNADFIGLQTQDLNLITAVLVAVALVLPNYRHRIKAVFKGRG